MCFYVIFKNILFGMTNLSNFLKSYSVNKQLLKKMHSKGSRTFYFMMNRKMDVMLKVLVSIGAKPP